MTSTTQNGTSSQYGRETLLRKLGALHHFMRECTTYQQELEAHWQLCAHCEERLVTQCPGCGNPVPPAGAYFCPRCGWSMPPIGA